MHEPEPDHPAVRHSRLACGGDRSFRRRRGGVGCAMTRFLLVRHGETRWNREMRIQGQGDSTLTPAGIAQADAVARRLASSGANLLVASDLGRTRQTARPIAHATGLPVRTDAGLRERSFGIFEGLTADEIAAAHPAAYRQWRERDPDFVIPEGESLRQLGHRVGRTLAEIAASDAAQDGGIVIVVTHGGVLDAAYRIAAGAGLDAPRDWPLPNGGISEIVLDAGRLRVGNWGDIAHLADARDDHD